MKKANDLGQAIATSFSFMVVFISIAFPLALFLAHVVHGLLH